MYDNACSSMSNGFGKSNTVSRNSNSFSSHSVVPAVRAGNHDGPLYVNSPRLSDYPWYIGTYNKTEASQKLNAQEDGVFLVRESKDNPGTYAIGIAYQGTAKHIKITKSPNEIYSIADYKNFESIQMLIQYYETHTLQDSFPELTTPLLIPFNRRNSVSRFSHVSHSNSFEFSSQTEMRRPSPRLRAGSSPSLLGSTALTPRPCKSALHVRLQSVNGCNSPSL
ncbi:VAV2 [Bugula neritina]|uniref:VAV2 n=1 Tax=Bugula neritina TaxID=10212 RepID=A0A7J7K9F7_BUGNE|nr:VAV2 [Bugula neritina]